MDEAVVAVGEGPAEQTRRQRMTTKPRGPKRNHTHIADSANERTLCEAFTVAEVRAIDPTPDYRKVTCGYCCAKLPKPEGGAK